MRKKLAWISAASLVALAPQAEAQAPPAKAARPPAEAADKPGTATVQGVTVTAPGQELRSSIDRRSYSLATDLQATTGSLGDALRNVPGVEVDVQGNVSLRGDANVTIMIDGKPSGMFKGDGRAAALQQLPADRIERVEVITNPSAAFDPEGSAGIINLITKKGQGTGRSGSARINYGDRGRYNASVSGSYNSRKLSLSADAGFRHDTQRGVITDRRTSLGSGLPIDSLNFSSGKVANDIRNVRLSLDYDLDATTRISGELRRFEAKFSTIIQESFDAGDAGGALTRRSARVGDLHGDLTNTEITGSYRKAFSGDDHSLTITARRDANDNPFRRPFVYLTGAPTPDGTYEEVRSRTDRVRSELKAQYKRPMQGEAKLVAGYELQIDDNDYDNQGLRGPSRGQATVDPTLTNLFRYDQTINTAYATYERPFGDLTVLAGLRLEEVRIKTDQVTTGEKDRNDYFRAYPSLHVAYELSDKQKLNFSYSHRVQRPGPFDLNPFRFYQDPFNYRQGNPRLKPQETHSYEVGYQYKAGQAFYLATAYYRENYNAVTDVVTDLGGGVLVTRRENLGSSRSAGLELVANGRLTPKLTYNVSGNLFWNEIDAAGLGFPQSRSTTSLSGRGNLNWQVTPDDLIQLNAFVNGKRLTPQGHREPWAGLNLGYRHKFSDRLSGVMTVQDVFDSVKTREIVETPLLHQQVDRRFGGRALFVGLTYAFGAADKRKPEPAFDFGGGAPTP